MFVDSQILSREIGELERRDRCTPLGIIIFVLGNAACFMERFYYYGINTNQANCEHF
jgi:hypothetical protein